MSSYGMVLNLEAGRAKDRKIVRRDVGVSRMLHAIQNLGQKWLLVALEKPKKTVSANCKFFPKGKLLNMLLK